jgi:hypothetical protein
MHDGALVGSKSGLRTGNVEPKSRMVSFRLSASEYAEAEAACRAHGYRSISLYARYAFLAFHSNAPRSDAYEKQIADLRERIDTMAAEMIRLSSSLRGKEEKSEVAAIDRCKTV